MPISLGLDSNIEYSITGHSGDSPDLSFLSFFDPRPKDEMERLRIMHEMVAHSQYTFPGDHTMEATKLAITNVINPSLEFNKKDSQTILKPASNEDSSKSDNIDRYVFVVSDANFERYGISPAKLTKIMKMEPRVKVHFILIASLDDEAKEILEALPRGHCHLCFESTDLPSVFRKILSEDAFELE